MYQGALYVDHLLVIIIYCIHLQLLQMTHTSSPNSQALAITKIPISSNHQKEQKTNRLTRTQAQRSIYTCTSARAGECARAYTYVHVHTQAQTYTNSDILTATRKDKE